jgi:hypothetical protein
VNQSKLRGPIVVHDIVHCAHTMYKATSHDRDFYIAIEFSNCHTMIDSRESVGTPLPINWLNPVAMEASSRHRERPLPSDNVTKPKTNDNRLPPGSLAAGGDRFLVLKPEIRRQQQQQQQQQRQRNSKPTGRATFAFSRAHPWGPDSQGLTEVETLAGDTATMGSSTWEKDDKDNSKSRTEKMLERRMTDRSSLFSRALRLDQEEEVDHFHSVIVRRGIETARRRQRTMPNQHWKTPYEVDAPRPIMLPRNHPQEASSRTFSSADDMSLSVEQQIWRGIERLMADAFSSSDDDDGSTVATNNPLPAALVRAMSSRSAFSTDSNPKRQDSKSVAAPMSDDEIEMAEMALTSFMDMLMPKAEGHDDDDSSLPTLASWLPSIDGSTYEPDHRYSSEETVKSGDPAEEVEVALNVFIGNLLSEIEKSQKPASLELLDLFAWTLRVNVDAHEKLLHLETEETANAQKKRELEDELKRHEEQRKLQIAEDLRRHEALLREKEAEEEELKRLEEEGNRLEEMLRLKVEEAARFREKSVVRDDPARFRGEPEMLEYIKPLNDSIASELPPSTPAGRRRAEAKKRQQDLESHFHPMRDDAVIDGNALATEGGIPYRSPDPRTEQFNADILSDHSNRSPHPLPAGNMGSPDGTPRSTKRTLPSTTIPTISSIGSDSNTEASLSMPDTVEPLKPATSSNPIWASIGGVPIVVSSDDDRSLDPLNLPHYGSRRASTNSATGSKMQAFSSTELKNRASFIAQEMSSGTISTLTTKSVPLLMPSESKRTLKAASMYESSDFSIDPTTLPNLSNLRNLRLESDSKPPAKETANHGPQWAAIGGRQIMMPTDENGISSTNTNVSPETAESGVLPSSFHLKNKLSSSGSVSTPSTRTLHMISSTRNLMQQGETSSVLTSDDMPDLKSLSEASYGESSSECEPKGTGRHAAIPKLFATKYSTRGAHLMPEVNLDDQLIFSASFVNRMKSAGSPDPDLTTLPHSFSAPTKMPRDHELPSSFIGQSGLDIKNQDATQAIPASSATESIIAASHVDLMASLVASKADGDAKNIKEKKDKKKKGKKKNKKKNSDKTTMNESNTDSFTSPGRANLFVSAKGDVFLDDVSARSMHNLSDGHFDRQILGVEDELGNASFPGTGARSYSSFGDVHLGSGFIAMSDDDESFASEMSIEAELRFDELRVEGKKHRIPVTKDAWKRRARPRKPIGNNILTRVKKFCWPPSRRKAEEERKRLDPDLGNSNGNLCLLHESDSPYDRTPVLAISAYA